MNDLLLQYSLAFIEGLALISSPCILPILPIMLSGSIEGGKKRPLGIITGFVITFALFTFFSRALVQYLGINLDILRNVAFIAIMFFGIVLLSDTLSAKFNVLTQKMGNLGTRYSSNQKQGFLSGLILGACVSLIWVPCAGPILAAAIVQAAVQKTSWQSVSVFFFFALGSVVPMMLIAFLGRELIEKFSFLKNKTHTLRKIFGLIIIFSAALAFSFNFSANSAPMNQAPNVVVQTTSKITENHALINALSRPYPAPDILDNTTWFNSAPLTLESLHGKVVLLDFWTYSCINCIRTLPYLKELYSKYHSQGLEIIGVHAPEFEFEKNPDNVKKAIANFSIPYPVVLDNNYLTWTAYKNNYWPAHYLINKDGMVVYQHFGEGEYDTLEKNIAFLLDLKKTSKIKESNHSLLELLKQTPETYLGFSRAGNYAGSNLVKNLIADYSFPSNLLLNQWALQGKWQIEAEKIISSQENAAVRIHFNAKNVYVVAGGNDALPVPVHVLLNGLPVGKEAGKDVENGILKVKDSRLYHVVNLKETNSGILELISDTPNLVIYTFTFG